MQNSHNHIIFERKCIKALQMFKCQVHGETWFYILHGSGETFIVSKRWFDKFTICSNLIYVSIQGKPASVDEPAASRLKKKIMEDVNIQIGNYLINVSSVNRISLLKENA